MKQKKPTNTFTMILNLKKNFGGLYGLYKIFQRFKGQHNCMVDTNYCILMAFSAGIQTNVRRRPYISGKRWPNVCDIKPALGQPCVLFRHGYIPSYRC